MAKHIIGAVLAGGQGIRLGTPHKGLHCHSPGKTVLEHVIGEIHKAGISDVVISANDPAPYRPFDKTIIADTYPGKGPLAGIEAVLAYAAENTPANNVLFLPSDLPGANAELVSRLVQTLSQNNADVLYAVEQLTGRPHSLCCVVPLNALKAIRNAVKQDRCRVTPLWNELGCQKVAFDNASLFFNINTPADLAAWQRDSQ